MRQALRAAAVLPVLLLVLLAPAAQAQRPLDPQDRLRDRIDRLSGTMFRRADLDLPLRYTYAYYFQSMLAGLEPRSLRPVMERILATDTAGLSVDLSTLINHQTLDMLTAVRLAAFQVLAALDEQARAEQATTEPGQPLRSVTERQVITLDSAGLEHQDPYIAQLLGAHTATLVLIAGRPALADALAAAVADPYGRIVWQLAALELALLNEGPAAAIPRLAAVEQTFAEIEDPDNRIYYAGFIASLADALDQPALSRRMREAELSALTDLVANDGTLDYGALGLVRRTLAEQGVEAAADRLDGLRSLMPPTLASALTAVIADHRTGRLPVYLLTGEPDMALQYALTLSELALLDRLRSRAAE